MEIDGSQHMLPERKRCDENKDALLVSLGWKVIRIREDVVKHNWDMIDKILMIDDYSGLENISTVGVFKNKKGYIKKVRDENGRTTAQNISSFNQRKVERPSKDVLYDLILRLPFTEIGKMYGVSDKSITKWCKSYGLPHRKKDIIENEQRKCQ